MKTSRRGHVRDFDDVKGFGHVEGDDGEVLFFHCTAIADGTRTIDPGVTVTFEVTAGHLGAYEARALRPA